MGEQDETIVIPMPQGAGMGVPQMTQQVRSDLIDKIKPEAMVEIIRHRLMGEEWLNDKWTPIAALKERRLTDRGAWEMANLMLGVSSINISISKLKDREIKERAFRIAKSAQYLLISNWKEYGLHNAAQFHYVHEIVFSNTLAVLKQADDASIQDLFKATIHENRNYVNTPKEKGGQRIGRMLGLTD